MAYVEGRVVHDADSHIMELPAQLRAYADPGVRDRIPAGSREASVGGERGQVDRALRRQADPEYRATAEREILLHKNWDALGAFRREDRPRALDALGFASQLVFNTFWSAQLLELEQGDDLELIVGAARAHNRAMADFCSVDRRLLATGYVPLADFAAARAMAEEAIGMGARALLVASRCPRRHGPSHVGLDPVWAVAQEAGVPVVFHVGGGGPLIDPAYFANGRPPVADFHGGAENFRSVDYMAIPVPPAQTLAALVIDGVLDRFPRLKLGVIEQGAIWLPGFMRQLDAAFEAFARHEARLRALSLRPSEYVRRQVRATPYPTEDVGWIIAQAGEEVCLFSSDYPHVEGGRNPVRRFESTMAGVSPAARDRFYRGNFEDLMGPAALDFLTPSGAAA